MCLHIQPWLQTMFVLARVITTRRFPVFKTLTVVKNETLYHDFRHSGSNYLVIVWNMSLRYFEEDIRQLETHSKKLAPTRTDSILNTHIWLNSPLSQFIIIAVNVILRLLNHAVYFDFYFI